VVGCKMNVLWNIVKAVLALYFTPIGCKLDTCALLITLSSSRARRGWFVQLTRSPFDDVPKNGIGLPRDIEGQILR